MTTSGWVLLCVLALTLAPGSEAGTQTLGFGELDPAQAPWARLRFEARKFFLKATTEVRLLTARRRELERQLVASPRSSALEPGGRISVLELDSSLAGRRSEIEVWFDAQAGSALQLRKLRHGKKAYQKTYRFTRGGVFSHRRAPLSATESRRPPAGWGKVEETFYSHPAESLGCSAIIEPTMLLYLAAAPELAAGQPLELCAFSSKVLSRVELRPTGAVPLAVDYAEISAGARTRRQGEIEALRIAIRARPLDRSEADFELLGLEGDVELFVAGGVPVEVGGRIPGFGRVRVRLTEVELRSRHPHHANP